MILKTTFVTIILLFIYLPNYACSCASFENKSFCDFVDYADYVVDATVIERQNSSGQIRLKINEVFKGEAALPDEILLQNMMCSAWLTEELGDHFILGLNKFDRNGSEDKYHLPLCGSIIYK